MTASIYPTPLPRPICDQRPIFDQSGVGIELRVILLQDCFPKKAKESSLPSYLPIAGKRTDVYIPFRLPLTRCEGDRGVMVLVVENGHGDTSSNPERD